MKVVLKHPISFGRNVIRLRKGGKILKADVRPDGFFYLWIESHFEGQGNEDRIFYIYGTGDSIPSAYTHVATFFQDEFVWHVYETYE